MCVCVCVVGTQIYKCSNSCVTKTARFQSDGLLAWPFRFSTTHVKSNMEQARPEEGVASITSVTSNGKLQIKHSISCDEHNE